MDLLTSRDNPRLRLLARLAERPREVRKAGCTVLDGVHLLDSLLDTGRAPEWGVVTRTALGREEVARAVACAAERGTRWYEVPDALLRAVSPVTQPSGVLTVLPLPLAPPVQPAPQTGCLLLLEDIQDPGNLGTLLRSAQAAGLTTVALSAACAGAWTPRVLRAGMGAHFHLVLLEDADLPALARSQQAVCGTVWAAAADGATLAWQAPLAAAGGLAIGNEGNGLSASLRAACGGGVAIPLAAGCESLNAAVAGSVLLFERARQVLAGTPPPQNR